MNTDTQSFVILLAEDEPSDAHLIKVALAENKFMVDFHHVVDGREALEFLQRRGPKFNEAPRPNLILLDLNMPRMDGRECLAAIKKDKDLRDIPVVILTTSEVERDVTASYDLGASGYITKPMDMNNFISIVSHLGDYWFKLVRLPHHT